MKKMRAKEWRKEAKNGEKKARRFSARKWNFPERELCLNFVIWNFPDLLNEKKKKEKTVSALKFKYTSLKFYLLKKKKNINFIN